jgi:CO dehydrogenase/acetyl-CoA synthase delta subunit
MKTKKIDNIEVLKGIILDVQQLEVRKINKYFGDLVIESNSNTSIVAAKIAAIKFMLEATIIDINKSVPNDYFNKNLEEYSKYLKKPEEYREEIIKAKTEMDNDTKRMFG